MLTQFSQEFGPLFTPRGVQHMMPNVFGNHPPPKTYKMELMIEPDLSDWSSPTSSSWTEGEFSSSEWEEDHTFWGKVETQQHNVMNHYKRRRMSRYAQIHADPTTPRSSSTAAAMVGSATFREYFDYLNHQKKQEHQKQRRKSYLPQEEEEAEVEGDAEDDEKNFENDSVLLANQKVKGQEDHNDGVGGGEDKEQQHQHEKEKEKVGGWGRVLKTPRKREKEKDKDKHSKVQQINQLPSLLVQAGEVNVAIGITPADPAHQNLAPNQESRGQISPRGSTSTNLLSPFKRTPRREAPPPPVARKKSVDVAAMDHRSSSSIETVTIRERSKSTTATSASIAMAKESPRRPMVVVPGLDLKKLRVDKESDDEEDDDERRKVSFTRACSTPLSSSRREKKEREKKAKEERKGKMQRSASLPMKSKLRQFFFPRGESKLSISGGSVVIPPVTPTSADKEKEKEKEKIKPDKSEKNKEKKDKGHGEEKNSSKKKKKKKSSSGTRP